MKIAIVYNRGRDNVINLFGMPNKERIGLKTIKRIADGLKSNGHVVRSFEGDKDIVDRLEEFMPRVVQGERPGMVFNLSYGIQGQARYTHVPSILEMIGIPYIGSGPLAHSLALDKVVAKMIFRQHGIPTPDFSVLDAPGFPMPELTFPMIVKPKNEAVSFGLKVVHSEKELREAADVIFDKFRQPVLVEQYIEGREINVGLLGNNPPEVLPPVELIFGDGPRIYTYEDKTKRSGREIGYQCPVDLDKGHLERVQQLASRAFTVLGCYDCARVDTRMDKDGNFYVLEINSLPSLGEHGSYTVGAAHAGLDFPALVNRLVDVASARYFGTPTPPQIQVREADIGNQIFSFLVERREQIERRVGEWVSLSSRTHDPVGLHEAMVMFDKVADDLALKRCSEFSDKPYVETYETRKGLAGGILLVGNMDIRMDPQKAVQSFRRDPERLYGEGIGVSRGSLVMLEYALRALRSMRALRKLPLGVLYYTDEGRDCAHSRETIKAAAAQARKVLVLRPGNPENKMISQRRGWRKYRLIVKDEPRRLGRAGRRPDVLEWLCSRVELLSKLSSRADRLAVAVSELRTEAFPRLLPHRVIGTVLVSYADVPLADETEIKMGEILDTGMFRCKLELLSDRPPMKKRKMNDSLVRSLTEVAAQWEIPLGFESSLYPSVAGLISGRTSAVCGIGPVAYDIDTPQESILRISLLQRTLLLAQFLAGQIKG